MQPIKHFWQDAMFEDQYGIGYKSYDDPWKEGCWIVNIG